MTDTQTALEALEKLLPTSTLIFPEKKELGDRIRAALQSCTEQEPVAWVHQCPHTKHQMLMGSPLLPAEIKNGWVQTPLYTSPPDQSARIAELEAEIAALHNKLKEK